MQIYFTCGVMGVVEEGVDCSSGEYSYTICTVYTLVNLWKRCEKHQALLFLDIASLMLGHGRVITSQVNIVCD